MRRAKALGLAGAGLSLAGAAFVAGSTTNVGAAPAARLPTVNGVFFDVDGNRSAGTSVGCPAGQIVTGGGGEATGGRTFFTGSFRAGNGWQVQVTNTGQETARVRAHAVCMARPS